MESKFYVQLIFELQIIKPLIQYYKSKEEPECYDVDIVSYGVGNFTKSRISQFQFALCILLKLNLKVRNQNPYFILINNNKCDKNKVLFSIIINYI